MQFNKENLFLAFNFAYDRQSVYRNKEILGMEAPWTTDPILQRNQFCNIYRENDKVSKIIIKNICDNDNLSPEDKFLNIVMARLTNSPFMFIGDAYGINTIDNFRKDEVIDRTTQLQADLHSSGDTLYPQVYRCIGKSGETRPMYVARMMQQAVDAVKSGKLSQKILHNTDSVEQCIGLINHASGFYTKPGFVFIQMFLDLGYCGFVPYDGNDFLDVGPGALRGGEIVHGLPQTDQSAANPNKAGNPLIRHIHSVQALGWKSLKDRTGKDWYEICEDNPRYKTDFRGQLSLMDVQNGLGGCEFRKWFNIRADGKGGKKYRGLK